MKTKRDEQGPPPFKRWNNIIFTTHHLFQILKSFLVSKKIQSLDALYTNLHGFPVLITAVQNEEELKNIAFLDKKA